MDNPLSSRSTTDSLLQKIVTDLKACISEIKAEFEEVGFCPLTDDCPSLNKFCAKLELLFQIGIQERSGIFGGSRGYWNYMQQCLSNNKNLKDGIRFVKSRSELKTNTGKGRALIRFSLVHHRLADTLQSCIMSERLNREWYSVKSIFHQKKLANDLLMTLYDLNEIQFDLDPRDAELDTTWPTFSRKTAGVVFNWRPPSRTESVVSLSSIPNLEIFPNFPSSVTPSIEESGFLNGNKMSLDSTEMFRSDLSSEEDVEKLKLLIAEANDKYKDASFRIQQLESELLAKENKPVTYKERSAVIEAHAGVDEEASKDSGSQAFKEKTEANCEPKTDAIVGVPDVAYSSLVVAPSAREKTLAVSHAGSPSAYLSTIESLQRQLVEAINAREDLSEKMVAVEADVERLAKFEVEAERLRQENAGLIRDVEELNQELRMVRAEHHQAELRSKEDGFFEKAFGDVMHDKAALESSLEQSGKENSDLLLKLETCREELLESEERLKTTVAEKQTLLNTVEDLKRTVDEQRGFLSGYELTLAEGRRRTDELGVKLAAIQGESEDSKRSSEGEFQRVLLEKEGFQKLLEETEESCKALTEKNSELEVEIQNVVERSKEDGEEGIRLKSRVKDLEEMLELNRISLVERDSEKQLLEESLRKAEAGIEDVAEANKNLELEKSLLDRDLQEKSEELRKIAEECQQAKDGWKEVEDKLEELEKSSRSLVEEKDKMIQDLQEDLDALTGSVQRREKMWESARISMDKAIVEKSAHIQTLEKTVADGFTKERLVVLEKKAEDLEETLEAVKLEQEIQLERANVQLDDLKQCLGALEHEKFLLIDELNQKDELLKQEQVKVQESKERWEEESASLKTDMDALKKRVIKLVKEKADLWQKTDNLAYEQKLRASYQWMNSADVTNCLICRGHFSVTVRKHHCRKCGRVLCYNCCNNWTMLPHSKIKERVCNECIMNESFLEATVNATNDDCCDEDSLSEEPASSNGSETLSILNESRTVDRDESSFMTCQDTSVLQPDDDDQSCDAKALEQHEDVESSEPATCSQSDDHCSSNIQIAETVVPSDSAKSEEVETLKPGREETVCRSQIATEVADEQNASAVSKTEEEAVAVSASIWSLSTSAKTAMSWMSTAANATTSFAASLIPKPSSSSRESSSTSEEPNVLPATENNENSGLEVELNRPNDLPLDESSGSKGTSDGDVFDVISPEEVSESRLYQISNPNMTCCSVIRLCGSDGKDVTTLSENEIWIKAGKSFAIPVSIEVIGLKLSWQFSTEPKGISFSVTYQELEMTAQDECVSLIPLTRLNSHQHSVSGELKAKKMGVYALLFDNQTSRFTAKKLKYRLQAEMTPQEPEDSQ